MAIYYPKATNINFYTKFNISLAYFFGTKIQDGISLSPPPIGGRHSDTIRNISLKLAMSKKRVLTP